MVAGTAATPPRPPAPLPSCGFSLEPAESEVEPTHLIPWDEIQAAFKAYGREPRVLSPSRQMALRARARETSPQALVAAVHGYMALHAPRPGKSNGAFEPLEHLTPETVYRPSNFPKYLEAYEREVARGRHPPFRSGGAKSARELFDEVIERGARRENP